MYRINEPSKNNRMPDYYDYINKPLNC